MKYSAAYTLCVLGGNDSPSAADLEKVIKLWKLSRDQLNARVQQLWAAGYRPGQGGSLETPAVGSGFDAADSESPA